MGFKVFRRKEIKLKEAYRHEVLISYTRSVQEYSQIIILTIEATKKNDFLKLTDEETPLKDATHPMMKNNASAGI